MTVTRKPLSRESSVFLNLIRLVSCELVVVGHFLTRYQPGPEASLRLGRILGGAAVLLFFVLSGLLISYTLRHKLGNPEYGFRNYFVDRFSRIYSVLVPALLLGAIITVIIYTTNHSYFVQLISMQSTPSPFTFAMTLAMLETLPVDFFNSLFSVFGLSFPLPNVTPFGFNGILWTLVVLWWIYIVFGWIVIGSVSLKRKHRSSKSYMVLFLAVAALLSLVLIGMYQENSGLVTVWFLGVLMMLAITSQTVITKLSSNLARKLLGSLFLLSVASALYGMYVAAWTDQYYGIGLGVLMATLVFLGVLFLNAGSSNQVSNFILNKHVVRLITLGAGFSYTLFVTHYPIVIFLAGLNLPVDRLLMFIIIMLITNLTAFTIAHFTERKYKTLARTIKKWLHISQC